MLKEYSNDNTAAVSRQSTNLTKGLPPCVSDYLLYLEESRMPFSSLLKNARCLRTFLTVMSEATGKDSRDITYQDMQSINEDTLDQYIHHAKEKTKSPETDLAPSASMMNERRTAIQGFYSYLFKNRLIDWNFVYIYYNKSKRSQVKTRNGQQMEAATQ
jgi:site-specific recombinase XerD